MLKLSVEELSAACKGRGKNLNSQEGFSGVTIDSRSVNKGDIFIALKGENSDGHNYVEKAIEGGASLAIVQKPVENQNIPHIMVEDTLKALQDISRYYIKKFKIPFIAVTGSSGKTTTKDMIAAVIGRKYNVLKTEGNYNNEIGLPLTVLRLDSSHDIGVLEMGMSALGEIELLADIVRPEIGVISNVGITHIELLGSRENILKAKLELFTYFNKNNTAVINGDDDMLKSYDSDSFKVIKYGLDSSNDIYAYNITEKGEKGIEFTVDVSGEPERFTLPLPGIHNVYNALSAISVAEIFGIGPEEIREGLLEFKPSKDRMEIITLKDGIKVINDVYNANPDSMAAAIRVLKSMKSGGRTICVLGDMFELGDMSQREHVRLGEYAANAGVDIVIAVGDFSGYVTKGVLNKRTNNSRAYDFSSNKEAAELLNEILAPGDVVLVKGSRGMKMEYIIDLLRERG
jgi:UDP-N-acetylmuramoyl-tripeptide--D-alanyl-D-alanine ligase